MAIYAMLGLIVVAMIVGVGVYWLIQNITFKQSNPYEYKTDKFGNEYVQDNTDEERKY
jgi:hypothetical protein